MRQTYEWIILNTWIHHVSHMNESCHTHTNESGDAYKWIMSPAQALCRRATGGARILHQVVGAGYYPRRAVTWLIHMCDMTHSCVWHDSFMRVTYSFICLTWLIHMCDVTHSYVLRDSFICVTWLIRMRDVTHSYVWRDSFYIKVVRVGYYPRHAVTWLINMRNVTH